MMEMRNKQSRRSRSGFVLPLTVAMIVLLTIMGLSLQRLGSGARMQAALATTQITAAAAADAGLTKAVFEMNKNLNVKPWNFNNITSAVDIALPNANAAYTYAIEEITVDSEYRITSIGQSGNAGKAVSANLRLQGPFEYAVLAVEGIDIKNNNLVTGYNSSTGETDLKAEIGTTSTAAGAIQLGLNTTINGNVIVGIGGDPATVIVNEGVITGGTYAASKEYTFPSITAPVLPDMGTIADVNSTTVLSPADNGQYAGITSDGGILEIDGGDVVLHVTGNINMDKGSEIRIKDGSSLTIYMDGSITCLNGSGINNLTSVPANFKVYSTGVGEQVFEIMNNSTVFGLIYAPNTDVTIINNASLYGSVIAKTFSLKNNGTFYYDLAERNVSVDDTAVRFVVKRWREG